MSKGILGYTLGVYGIIGFLVAFFGSRAFAVLNPSIVVVQGEVHFHHFWYGLGMVTLSGWLGISFNRARLLRTYALIFGLGAGLIGDEIGLFLTFGNYQSELTTDFFVGVIGFIVLVPMFLQYKTIFRKDTTHEGWNERLVHLGVALFGISTIFFAIKAWTPAVLLAALGVVVVIASFEAAKAGVLAGLAAGSFLAAGNFLLLYYTDPLTSLLGGESLPPDLGLTLDQLALLLALVAAIISLLIGIAGGALLGLVFSAVRNRYMRNYSLQTRGITFGIVLWAVYAAFSASLSDYGSLLVSLSVILALAASLAYGYLLGSLFLRFRRKTSAMTPDTNRTATNQTFPQS
ncbi:hypothetical protein E6H15_07580 [Candidatus Bathyarchaeota archaeon]|nr:MAG: hypothetical protein E6H15_07580 [Candidatus Bathyarchaeota archaeon]